MNQNEWQDYDQGWITAMSSSPPLESARFNQAYMDGYYEARAELMEEANDVLADNPFLDNIEV